jgi:hypothetical protein
MYFHVRAVYDSWDVKYGMMKYNENMSSDIFSLFLKAHIFYTQQNVCLEILPILTLPSLTAEYKITPGYLL